ILTAYSGAATALPTASSDQALTVNAPTAPGSGVRPSTSGAGELRTFGSAAPGAGAGVVVRTSTSEPAGAPFTPTTAYGRQTVGNAGGLAVGDGAAGTNLTSAGRTSLFSSVSPPPSCNTA